MLKGKSKPEIEEEVSSGHFPPCLCVRIQFSHPEDERMKYASLTVDLLDANVPLTFSCTIKEQASEWLLQVL